MPEGSRPGAAWLVLPVIVRKSLQSIAAFAGLALSLPGAVTVNRERARQGASRNQKALRYRHSLAWVAGIGCIPAQLKPSAGAVTIAQAGGRPPPVQPSQAGNFFATATFFKVTYFGRPSLP